MSTWFSVCTQCELGNNCRKSVINKQKAFSQHHHQRENNPHIACNQLNTLQMHLRVVESQIHPFETRISISGVQGNAVERTPPRQP